jgi:hypothetical protein
MTETNQETTLFTKVHVFDGVNETRNARIHFHA